MVFTDSDASIMLNNLFIGILVQPLIPQVFAFSSNSLSDRFEIFIQ